MNPDDLLKDMDTISHPARLQILSLLAASDLGMGELIAALKLSGVTVAAHVTILKEAGFIELTGQRLAFRLVHTRLSDIAIALARIARLELVPAPGRGSRWEARLVANAHPGVESAVTP